MAAVIRMLVLYIGRLTGRLDYDQFQHMEKHRWYSRNLQAEKRG